MGLQKIIKVVDIKNKIDDILIKVDSNPSIDTIEQLIAEILELISIKTEDRFLLNLKRIDEEYNRFIPAPNFAKKAAAFEIPNSHSEILDLKLYWVKKTTKSNLAWLIGLTPNFEDDPSLDYANISIDFVIPENCQSLIILLSNQYQVRSLELKQSLKETQYEIFTNWKNQINPEELNFDKAKIHQKLWESFDLNPINKSFYSEVISIYKQLKIHLTHKFDETSSILFSTRFLSRMMFIWFLRKKGFINEAMNYFNNSGYDDDNDYYHSKLEKLFYGVLNTLPEARDNDDKRTPYLNGGLFESKKTKEYNESDISFPKYFFDNFFKIFNKYNFTVDESSSDFQYVAIDPEMLGKILESLLGEEINPETNQSQRQTSGSFYTPRWLVSYMCEQSIIKYLKNNISNTKNDDLLIEEVIRLPENIFRDQDQNKRRDWKEIGPKIINALGNFKDKESIKILDPAVGSGAFPIAMLQLLVKIYSRLSSKYEKNSFSLKKNILANNLFGVDILQPAIQICRLRAWLSLIVDVDSIEDIEPLPNLDFKFIAANTLISIDYNPQQSLAINSNLRDDLIHLKDSYYKTSSDTKKKKLQDQYLNQCKSIDLFDDRISAQIKTYNPFDITSTSEFYDPGLHHGLDAFDIVIANPPYHRIEKLPSDEKKNLAEMNYYTFEKSGDKYCLFYEKCMKLLNENGSLCLITSNKWMRAAYGKLLRNYLQNYNITEIINFGPDVFDSATVDTSIVMADNAKNKNNIRALDLKQQTSLISDLSDYFKNNSLIINSFPFDTWSILTKEEVKIALKIRANGTELYKIPKLSIMRGVLTGLNEAFIISSEVKENIVSSDNNARQIIKPILKGKHISKYEYTESDLYLILSKHDLDLPKEYPFIYNHLKKFEEKATARGDKGDNWYNLRQFKDYTPFEKVKIFWSDISTSPSFSIIPPGVYADNTVYMISGDIDMYYLLSILNSSLMAWYFPLFAQDLGQRGTRYFAQYVKKIPIPEPSDSNKATIQELSELGKLASDNKNLDVHKKILAEIDQKIFELYEFTPDDVETFTKINKS